jgi:polyphosphate kinase
LADEVARVFDFINKPFEKTRFRHLLVSPFNSRQRFTRLVNREIKNAEKGLPAFIVIKINNLTDPRLISRLYKASQSGVDVRLMVRGMFAPVVGVKGMSDNMEAVGLIDRFLEHSRILVFCNAGDEEVYLSSADWMPRNLDRRIEVACPIYDKPIRDELMRFVDLHWRDAVKSRLLTGSRLRNEYKEAASGKPVRAQEAVYAWLRQTLTDARPRKGASDKTRLRAAT